MQLCVVDAEEYWIIEQNWKKILENQHTDTFVPIWNQVIKKVIKKKDELDNCLPSCSSIAYQEEISKSNFFYNKNRESRGKNFNSNE